ncbi:multiprotein-bridging factor 1 family protein [Kitasatospora sp. NPDC058170]|uniref:helix-turn-helix domain-containing protein n=1 Tax=Kitasatospora sp. NPDC058170 TaxID=3346364 RepID=UPI0036D85597
MSEQASGNRRFVAARVERGWHTQQDFADAYDARAESLGEKARISVRQVRRWEAGRSAWPNRDARRVLDSMFGVPVEELGFVRPPRPTGRAAPDIEQRPDVDKKVLRRAFPGGGLAAAASVLDLAALEHLTAASRDARRYSDGRLVEHLRAALDETAHTDGTAGPHQALPTALGLIAAINSSAREADPGIRHQLLHVGARAAELVAWLHRDAGAPPQATAYWHAQAKEWATLVGDGAMHAYVLLRQAQATDRADAVRMLDLARAATGGPWSLPPRPRAEAYQQEARALALTGASGDEVARVLDLAHDALDRASPADAEPTCTGPLGDSYTAERLMVQSAVCYREAHQPELAVGLFRQYLAGSSFAPRDRAFFTAQLSGTLVEAGEPDEAAVVALQAFELAAGARYGQALAELRRTAGTLEPWNRRPAVRELEARLLAVTVA